MSEKHIKEAMEDLEKNPERRQEFFLASMLQIWQAECISIILLPNGMVISLLCRRRRCLLNKF